MCINSPPNKNDISQKYSPCEIVTRHEMDFKNNCLCELGKYVKSRSDYVVTNDMTPETNESIALGPSGNPQGTHKVFCLETGIVIKPCLNTAVPMPYRLIKKINQWGDITKREQYGRKLKIVNRAKEK